MAKKLQKGVKLSMSQFAFLRNCVSHCLLKHWFSFICFHKSFCQCFDKKLENWSWCIDKSTLFCSFLDFGTVLAGKWVWDPKGLGLKTRPKSWPTGWKTCFQIFSAWTTPSLLSNLDSTFSTSSVHSINRLLINSNNKFATKKLATEYFHIIHSSTSIMPDVMTPTK